MHDAEVRPLAAVLVGAPDAEIVELEARIRAAQLGADVAALDALIDEDLLFTGPDGTLGTKAQDLAAHGHVSAVPDDSTTAQQEAGAR
jgi:Domain of unknown function (DUF4440)